MNNQNSQILRSNISPSSNQLLAKFRTGSYNNGPSLLLHYCPAHCFWPTGR